MSSSSGYLKYSQDFSVEGWQAKLAIIVASFSAQYP